VTQGYTVRTTITDEFREKLADATERMTRPSSPAAQIHEQGRQNRARRRPCYSVLLMPRAHRFRWKASLICSDEFRRRRPIVIVIGALAMLAVVIIIRRSSSLCQQITYHQTRSIQTKNHQLATLQLREHVPGIGRGGQDFSYLSVDWESALMVIIAIVFNSEQ